MVKIKNINKQLAGERCGLNVMKFGILDYLFAF